VITSAVCHGSNMIDFPPEPRLLSVLIPPHSGPVAVSAEDARIVALDRLTSIPNRLHDRVGKPPRD